MQLLTLLAQAISPQLAWLQPSDQGMHLLAAVIAASAHDQAIAAA